MAAEGRFRRRAYKELTLQQLRSLHTVARLGSYAAAARELLLTPPAVFEQLKALERHYGMPLLERQGNGVRPTTHGERLMELTRPHLAGVDATREVLRQELAAWPSSMTLVTNLRVFAAEISQGMRRFQRLHGDIRLKLSYLRDAQLTEAVLFAKADVAVTLEPGPTGLVPGLMHEVVGEVDYLLVTPLRHPLAKRTRFRLPDLARYPLVLGDELAYSRQRVQEVFHRHHLIESMTIAVETNSDEYSTHCVRAGLGVAITIGLPSAWLYRGLHVRSLRHWFGNARLSSVWRKGAERAPASQELARQVSLALTNGSQPNE
jgi:DNA-binding transcriptional LysR family regulator